MKRKIILTLFSLAFGSVMHSSDKLSEGKFDLDLRDLSSSFELFDINEKEEAHILTGRSSSSRLGSITPSPANTSFFRSYSVASLSDEFDTMLDALGEMRESPNGTQSQCQQHALESVLESVENDKECQAPIKNGCVKSLLASFSNSSLHLSFESLHHADAVADLQEQNAYKSLQDKQEKFIRLEQKLKTVKGKARDKVVKELAKIEEEIGELQQQVEGLKASPRKTSPSKFLAGVGRRTPSHVLKSVGLPTVALSHVLEGHFFLNANMYKDVVMNKHTGVLSVIYAKSNSTKLLNQRKSMFPQNYSVDCIIDALQDLALDKENLHELASWSYGLTDKLGFYVGFRANNIVHVETAFPVLRCITSAELRKADEYNDKVYIASRAAWSKVKNTYIATEDVYDSAVNISAYALASKKIIAKKIVAGGEVRLVDISDKYPGLFYVEVEKEEECTYSSTKKHSRKNKKSDRSQVRLMHGAGGDAGAHEKDCNSSLQSPKKNTYKTSPILVEVVV